MVDKINISEGDIRNMVMESVKRILGEANEFARGIPAHIRDKFIKKVAAENPELDPNGFYYTSTGDLLHNGKKRPKAAPKPVISKPEGMSDEEYEQKLVIPNNPKYKEKLEKYPDEEFAPVVNGGRYFGGAADYGCDYEVSNRGRLKVINHSNVLKSDIYDPYPAPTRKAMQFTMIGYGSEGDKMRTTPSVSYMVANAFLGEHDPAQWVVIHKDGDWQNNNVENLEWVPKKNRQ